MPLFRSKFQPKKCPARKTSTVSNLRRNMDALQLEREFSIQIDKVKLDLGENQQFEFNSENAKWVSISTAPNAKAKPSTLLQKLEGENNYLKIQADLLLTMLTETALEAHLNSLDVPDETTTETKSSKKNSFRGRKLF
ncbi:protein chibby homolog 1-like [Daphnia pulicaria]|uniref:protein chibby homolog 1-like n=1 Tax=Daphnia pulicaria TaxID=35523 RepID=UPI001EEA13D2|nr:protein chibby homolog 1-like [Daphnia pulicaria]